MKKILLLIATITACASNSPTIDNVSRIRHPDAAVDSPPAVDAPDPTASGWVSCYTSGQPTAEVNLSIGFCCFDEIDVPHNGWEVNWGSTCTRSWNYCDGGDDCPGALCTERLVPAPFYDGSVFAIECRPSLDAGDYQLCHPGDGTCPSGTACQLGNAVYYGLPPTLYLCY